MYSTRIISTATVAAAMLLSGGIAQGVPTADQLVITENSSTSLTAILNGSALTVANTSADAWVIYVPSPANGMAFWLEPGGNSVNEAQVLTFQINIFSDRGPSSTALPNGAIDTNDFTLAGVPMHVTFNDNAVDSVPDATSTLLLLGFSLGGLAIVARRCMAKAKG